MAEQDGTMTSHERKQDVAVVLIHGIGNFRPGSILKSCCSAISRDFNSAGLAPINETIHWLPQDGNQQYGHVNYNGSRYSWKDQKIDLIEFHWSDVAGKIRLRQPVDAFVKVLNILATFPLLGVISAAKRIKFCANLIGAFHCFLLCWALLGAIIVTYEEAKILGVYMMP